MCVFSTRVTRSALTHRVSTPAFAGVFYNATRRDNRRSTEISARLPKLIKELPGCSGLQHRPRRKFDRSLYVPSTYQVSLPTRGALIFLNSYVS